MVLLSGKEVQEDIKRKLKEEIENLVVIPKLVIVQVGHNEQSEIYIRNKKKLGEELGIVVEHKKFSESTKEEELIQEVEKGNKDQLVGGIIIQLPVPKNLDLFKILNSIKPEKDVDGLGVNQTGLLYGGNDKAIIPATARGIMSLLDFYKIDLESKNVVIIGRSNLVGRPVAQMCLNRDATVTICHSHTKNLKEITQKADILIVACGIPKFINDEHINSSQVVVDVGINKADGKICGDVDFDKVKDIVYAITPVPGGVGPLTVVSLFQNLLDRVPY